MVFPLLEIVDENELGLNEAVRNANQPNEAIWIITKYKLLFKRGNKNMVKIMGKQKELL